MDFNSKAIRGYIWSFATELTQFVLTIASQIVLARLLLPSDFGIFAMVQVFAGFALAASDIGLGNAIIHSKRSNQMILSTAFWINVIFGLTITTIFFYSAESIAVFFGHTELVEVTRLMSLTFIMISLGKVHLALLSKRIDLKSQFVLITIGLVISFGVSICLALRGFGPITLAFQQVTRIAIQVILAWIFARWYPSFILRLSLVKNLIAFSKYLYVTTLTNYWTQSIDNLLIGRMLGAQPLGIYSKAYSFMQLPLNNISNMISKVMFPSFASIQDDKARIKSAYLKISFVVSLISFPLFAGLVVTSPLLIPFLFGEEWREMIFVSQVLAAVGLLHSISSLNRNLYLSQGETYLQFKVTLATKILIIISMIIGLAWGLEGVVIAYLLSNFLVSYQLFKYPLKLINTSPGELFHYLRLNLISSILMALLIYIFIDLYRGQIQSAVLLLYCVILGISIYAGILLLLDKARILSFLMDIRSLRK